MAAYGWIQNPGKFENLQHVVQIFDSNSRFIKGKRLIFAVNSIIYEAGGR
ncbi:restriction endonuclease FokI recognition domain-containing protein [Lactiplantibacillus plantarum]